MRIISYKNIKLLVIIVFFAILLSSDRSAGKVAELPCSVEHFIYEQSIPVEVCRGMAEQIATPSERDIERCQSRYTDIAFATVLFSVGTISGFCLLIETGESVALLECQILEFIHDSDGKKGDL